MAERPFFNAMGQVGTAMRAGEEAKPVKKSADQLVGLVLAAIGYAIEHIDETYGD